MKIIILGSKGMAGHVIRHVLLQSKDCTIIDIARNSDSFSPTYQLDVSRTNELAEILSRVDPDILINCIGILNQDAETNPDKAVFYNSYLPHFLAKKCRKLIHISTDCVFSGEKGNYLETDAMDGNGFYARSKALGEVTYGDHLTIRTSIVGPELKFNGIGLLNWFMNQQSPINGYARAMWSGITTLQLAKSLSEIISRNELTGLLHLTNNEKISKYDLLKTFSREMDRPMQIVPQYDYKVDKSFLNSRKDHPIIIPSYDTMVAELWEFMVVNQSNYYGHYFK